MNSPSPNNSFLDLLKDPNSSLDDVISSGDFFKYWSKSEPMLFSYIINHYDELINIGFQIERESTNSIRCLQIMSAKNFSFYHLLINKTNLLKFMHDYIFNIDKYPPYSQKNYFFVLPNLIIDKLGLLRPIFDEKYFNKLFNLVANDYACTFILRLIQLAPLSMSKVLEQINLDKHIVTNILKYSDSDNWSPLTRNLLIRNQVLFRELATSKFGTNLASEFLDQFDTIISRTIDHPCAGSLEFLCFIDHFATEKVSISKWHKVHMKIIPHLDSFCAIATTACEHGFTPLAESCTKLSIRIVSTTKKVTESFIALFMYLVSFFFKEETNTFLHNCTLSAFELLLSLGSIDAQLLDKIELFVKVTKCFEMKKKKGHFVPYFGQLRKMAHEMEPFAARSETVDMDKWTKYVVIMNRDIEKVERQNFGGHVPNDLINDIKRPIFKLLNHNPSFTAKNLKMEEKHFKKHTIKSPLA